MSGFLQREGIFYGYDTS